MRVGQVQGQTFSGRAVGGLVAMAMLAFAGVAQGQDLMHVGEGDDLRLTLICQGADNVTTMGGSGMRGRRGGMGGMGGPMSSGVSRVSAQLGVLVEGRKVRVRPPPTSLPMFAKPSKDGWFELSKAEVDATAIRGRASLGGMVRPRLDVDRRTGSVTFGGFSGVCRAAPGLPGGTVF